MTQATPAAGKRTLGKHSVCPIGLGCMSLSLAYGAQLPDEQGKEILHRALDLGYDHLDTARLYGMGHNETLLGETLRGLRDRFFLASKTGIFVEGNKRWVDCSPKATRAACEESLRLLQTDHIDLYYLHRHDDSIPIEEAIEGMAQLVQEGKIGGIGLSEVSAPTLRRAAAVHPITAVQNEYSLWTRNPEIAVLDACRELGTTFVAFSPLGRGVLANSVQSPEQIGETDFRKTMPRFLPENWGHNYGLICQFNGIAAEQGVSPAQLALAWVLSRGEHVVAIPGTGNMRHLEENIARHDWQPDADVLERLDQLINQQTIHGHRYSEAMRANIDSEDFA